MKLLRTTISLLTILTLSVSFGSAQNKVAVDSLMKVLDNDISKEDQIMVYMALAKEHASSDSIKMATYIRHAKEIAEEIDKKEVIADALFLKGRYFHLRGKRSQAAIAYTEALEESKKIGYAKGEALAYARIASTYLFRGNMDTAAVLFTRAIEQQKLINDKKGLVFSYHGMGNYNSFKGNLKEARDYYFQEIELKQSIGDRRGYSAIHVSVGNTFARQGIFIQALEYYFKAAEGLEKSGNKRYLATVTNNIGNVFLARNDYTEALNYYERSLELRRAMDDSLGVADCYNNIGTVYSSLQKSDQAIDHFKKSLVLRERLGNQRGMATSFFNLGNAYSSIAQWDEALSWYQQSLELRSTRGDKKGMAQALMKMGNVNLEQNDLAKASKFINEGLSMAEGIGSLEDMKMGYDLVAELENKRTNYLRAYNAHVRYKELADSLLNQEQTKEITRMEAEYTFQKERDSVAFEHAKIQLGLEQEIERRKLVNRGAIGGGTLVLIILILLYRSYLIKQKRNIELRHKNELIESKNTELTFKNDEIMALRETEKKMAAETLDLKERELTNITMLSYEKNELLQHIGDQIGRIGDKVDDRILPDLKEIKKTIKSNISDETWHSFTYHFEQVHPQFFNKLKAQFEDLSQNDLRLCAYIKVGLNNKVIAQMGNITLAAVKKNINRVKKKLVIGPDDSLRDFIMEFV